MDDEHDSAGPAKGADEAQTRELRRGNTGIGASHGDCNPQSRQKSNSQNQLRCVLLQPALDHLAPAGNLLESIQPGSQPTSRRIEPKLITGPAAEGSGDENSEWIEPTQ